MEDVHEISVVGVMSESEVSCMLNMLLYSALLCTFVCILLPLFLSAPIGLQGLSVGNIFRVGFSVGHNRVNPALTHLLCIHLLLAQLIYNTI